MGRRDTAVRYRLGSHSSSFVSPPVTQQRPDDARNLCGERHDRGIGMRPREQATQPGAQPRIALPQRWHSGSCALDQHFAKIFAPALGDTKEPRLASGRLLAWYEAEPCGEITTAGEGPCIADGRDECRRVQRTDAGNGD